MRKTIITLVALSAVAFTGCDTDTNSDESNTTSFSSKEHTSAPAEVETPEPEATPEPAPEPEPEEVELPDSMIDDLYVDTLQSEFPGWFGGVPASDLIDNGKMMCSLFTGGASFEDVIMMTMDAGYPSDVAASYIGYTIGAYCPEAEDVLN